MEIQVSSALNNSIGGFSVDTFHWIGYVMGYGIGVMITIALTFHAIQWFRHIAGLNPPKAPDKQLSGEGYLGSPSGLDIEYDGHHFGSENAVDEYKKARGYVNKRAGL